MNDFVLIDEDTGNKKHFDSRSEAESMGEDLQINYSVEPANGEEPDPSTGTSATDMDERTPDDVEVIDMAEDTTTENKPDTSQSEASVPPKELSEDPIKWLKSKNTDFVNVIKGTPAISKQGFRYIQQRYGITTESKVVATFDDPLGVVVWAKAERPDGQSAEAHGEGYQFESGLDDNEFVRYADTRSKNRAISDLTSAGALAVSELSGKGEE